MKYKLICYLRIETEGDIDTLEEAEKEKEQQEFLFPKNKYEIEAK